MGKKLTIERVLVQLFAKNQKPLLDDIAAKLEKATGRPDIARGSLYIYCYKYNSGLMQGQDGKRPAKKISAKGMKITEVVKAK
jgi:hypothetical protein